MATFSIDVPDDQVPTIADAFAETYAMPEVEDATTEEKIEFARQEVMKFVATVVQGWHINKETEAARVAAQEAADSMITLS